MNRNPARPLWIVGLLFGAPLLLGAQGRGCAGAHAPSTPVNPTATCVANHGEHCGGNTTHPCTCAAGLVCTPGSGGLPFGDVGGTCESPTSADAGSSACVSQQGEHCGGNTAHPCTCAAGLTCTPGSSGLPFGDVGGTCRGPSGSAGGGASPAPGAGSAGGGASPTPDAGSACVSSPGGHCGGNTTQPCTCAAGLVCTPGSSGLPFGDVGGTCQSPDAGGACVSNEGGPCGGNTSHPCTCASGLMCMLSLGGPAPGDVGGTCMPPADAGGACVSNEGEHCGGNIAHPCSCASGLTCTGAPGGPPAGDVGGTCKGASGAGSCVHDADCHLEADYCTGCDCVALGKGESVRTCPGPGVSCFADPCAIKTVACESGACVAH